jgi:integrase
MAVIQKRIGSKGTSYRALIRRAGSAPISKTFSKEKEAEQWARKVESQMDDGAPPPIVSREASMLTLGQALERYKNEVSFKNLGAEKEAAKIKFLMKQPLAERPLSSITREEFEAYRDARLKVRAESTVLHDLIALSNVYKRARETWKVRVSNPLADMWKPAAWANKRSDRIETNKDQKKLFDAMCKIDETFAPGSSATKRQKWVRILQVEAMRFQLETAARIGEVLKLQWKHVDLEQGCITIYRAPSPTARLKGGTRTIPLTDKAMQILRALPITPQGGTLKEVTPHGEKRVFPVDYKTLARALRMARTRAGLSEQLSTHVFRREGTTRLAAKLSNPLDLAKITGHTSLQTLMRYYQPTLEDLRRKFR